MNSESHRSQDDHICDFAAKTPMFFKIILENAVREGKLEIPSGFARNFGNCLRSPIKLKVPNGNTWEVELLNVGEEIWLGKGWKKFSEHYSLKHGHMLVFKYEGNSYFSVLIFDTSALEIEYPGSATHSEPEQPCNFSKFQPSMNKNKEITAFISADPMVKLKTQSTDKNSLNSDWHIQEFQGNLATGSKVVGANRNDTNFTPSNPSFKVVLKSNHIQQKYLNVPFSFMEKHMELEAKTVILKVGDRSWPVKLNVYLHNRVAGLYGGMPSFLRENSLEEGDVCVFRLISNNTLNVSIFRT